MAFQPNLIVDNSDLHASQDAGLLISLTTVHTQFGMHQTAYEFAMLANWIKPNDSTTLQLMAQSLLHLQRAEDALDVLDEIDIVKVDPETESHVLALRGSCLASLGQVDKARAAFSASQKIGGQDDQRRTGSNM